MKKFLVCAFAAAALMMTSCTGNDTKKDTPTADVPEVVETPNFSNALKEALDKKDAASIQSAIEAAEAEIANLKASGKLEQAKEALQSLQSWLKENAETVKSVVGEKAAGLIDKASTFNLDSVAVPTAVNDVAEKVEEAKAVAEDVKATAEEVKASVEEAKEAAQNVKEDVQEAAKDVKDKVDAAKGLLKKK